MRRRERKEGVPVVKRKARIPDCHPDRPHHARGMCASCYMTWLCRTNGRCGERAKRTITKWHQDHPDEVKEHKMASRIPSTRSLPKGWYRARLIANDYLCECCGTQLDPEDTRRTHVDHNHVTGAVRGIICGRCNVGLGTLGDSIECLERALAYLRRTDGD